MATSPGGFKYKVQKVAGGEYHVWPNGLRTFVPTAAPAAAPAPAYEPTEGDPYADAPQPAAAAAVPTPTGPDATYYANQAKRIFSRDQALSQNQAQGVTSAANRTKALETLRRNQPIEENAATGGANAQGLFYSTTLGNKLGDIRAESARRQGEVESGFQTSEQARAAARAAIEQGYQLDDAADLAAAADRQIARDTEAADTGSLVRDYSSLNNSGFDYDVSDSPITALSAAANTTQVKPLVNLRKPRTAAQMRAANPAMTKRVQARFLAAARRSR